MKEEDNIKRVSELLKGAKSALFITGAGISADSGLPTYRGIGGLYNDKTTDEGIPIEMALAGEMLNKRPEVTWKYLAQIENNCRKAACNRGHEIIAQIENKLDRVWVLTQNIDGFHLDAGSKNVIEIHGNFHNLKCTRCRYEDIVEDYSGLAIPPKCPMCNSVVRPDVVFFGEMLDIFKIETLENELKKGFDLYFWVGTTAVFPYIQRPVYDVKRLGAVSIEINPADTEISDLMDIKIRQGAKEALEGIWK